MKKHVLITGANHGLGLSLTKVFLSHGYTVFAGVYQLNDDSQINSIKGADGLHLVDMDVSSTQSIREAAALISGLTSSIDILINNAGILCHDSYTGDDRTILDTLDPDSMIDPFNVNALGALRVSNAFAPLLICGGDKLLINISSEAGSISDCARTQWFGYCMSKAAMNMAGALMHNELVKHGGQVWQIHPGWMQTYMHGNRNEKADYPPDFTAERLYDLVRNADEHKSQNVVFMDLFGKDIAW